jgi:hypothetical protein
VRSRGEIVSQYRAVFVIEAVMVTDCETVARHLRRPCALLAPEGAHCSTLLRHVCAPSARLRSRVPRLRRSRDATGRNRNVVKAGTHSSADGCQARNAVFVAKSLQVLSAVAAIVWDLRPESKAVQDTLSLREADHCSNNDNGHKNCDCDVSFRYSLSLTSAAASHLRLLFLRVPLARQARPLRAERAQKEKEPISA